MKLKDFKKNMAKEEYDIPDVFNKVKPAAYTMKFDEEKSIVQKEKRTWVFYLRKATLFGFPIIILFFIFSLFPGNLAETFSQNETNTRTILNQNDLNETVKTSNKQRFKENFSISINPFQNKNTLDNSPTNESIDISSISKTNIQVDGVDEIDFVKADSNSIYTFYQNTFSVTSINKDTLDTVYSISFNNGEDSISPYGLYQTQKYLIVMFGTYRKITPYANKTNIFIYEKDSFSRTTKTVEPVEKYSVSGNLSTARLIDNHLYFASIDYIYNNYYKSPEDIKLPEINGNPVAYSDINYINDTKVDSFLLLSSIDLEKEISMHTNIQLFSRALRTVYSTKTSLYLVTTNFLTESIYPYTSILKYHYEPTKNEICFSSSVNIRGTILNQFSLDEHEGYLRVALTEQDEKTKNKLIIFEEIAQNSSNTLVEIGRLDKGLGKEGETIKSVRFRKEQALVVTYRNTDPLYKIDLSNPKNPVLLSEGYEEPGYNSYLHFLKNDLAFGIGYTEGLNNTKFSVYDIKENTPTLIKEHSIDTVNVEALHNHKALFIDNDLDTYLVGFASSTKQGGAYQYHIYSIQSQIKAVNLVLSIHSSTALHRMIRISNDTNYYYVIGENNIKIYNDNFHEIKTYTYLK